MKYRKLYIIECLLISLILKSEGLKRSLTLTFFFAKMGAKAKTINSLFLYRLLRVETKKLTILKVEYSQGVISYQIIPEFSKPLLILKKYSFQYKKTRFSN